MNNPDISTVKDEDSGVNYQTFRTKIPISNDPLDPVDLFEHKTAATIGIQAEVHVSFGCDQVPKIERTKITGLNQVGFIVSSEYEVYAYIDRTRQIACRNEGCDHAIQYEIDVRFIVYLVIGLGFGFGWGTGTAGFRTRKSNRTETYTTRCICCDKKGAQP